MSLIIGSSILKTSTRSLPDNAILTPLPDSNAWNGTTLLRPQPPFANPFEDENNMDQHTCLSNHESSHVPNGDINYLLDTFMNEYDLVS